MKRSPLRRGKPLERRSGVKKVSKKRSRKLRAWPILRALCAERERWRCQCCKRRTGMDRGDAHHWALRSQGGPDELWNLRWLCHSCHETRVHAHPRWARENDLMAPKGYKHQDGAA